MLDGSFRLERDAKIFGKHGFHTSKNPLLATMQFAELMKEQSYSWYCSLYEDDSKSDPEHLVSQFEHILRAIGQKYQDARFDVVFENNQSLNGDFLRILKNAFASRVEFSLTIAGKDEDLLAMPDYCLSIASKAFMAWRRHCCNPASVWSLAEVRTLAGIEPNCSLLYSFDARRPLSSRQGRLGEKSYLEVFGRHSAECLAPGRI
jgi:hypothetical protein